MIAAIYARKSTEQRVADEQKSVERQVAHAREYAARKGWVVDDAHIYVDDGISGAEFARRPAFVRLMAALTPRPPFQGLIMSEESRLGRESIETAYALKQLVSAGVRVFFYLEDRERTLDSPMDKVMLALQTMADEMEREKARQRAHDKARALARAGYVSGGKCFGYDNVPVIGPNGERSHVEQRIKETEAAVVRRIFELAATGYGQVQIAKMLNAEGAPAPRSQQGRPRAWVSSSVHEALFRPRYRGEIVWNRTKKRDRWGQHRATDRSQDQWLRVPAPHLRIVPEELWQAAHAKITAARSATNLYRGRGSASPYLLPGLARCALCNGGMQVRTRTRSGGNARYYACTSYFHRGETVCSNSVQIPMEMTDRAVLARLRELVTVDIVDGALARLRELHNAEADRDPRVPVHAELATINTKLEHLAEAIATAGAVPTLMRRLQALEARRQVLLDMLTTMPAARPVPQIDWATVERDARRTVREWWQELFGEDVPRTRRVLRALLEEPLRFTPIERGGRRGYRFEGTVTFGEMMAGNIDVLSLASPGRIELPA